MVNQYLKITDDSGFIAIVNPAKYNSFLSADWNFEQLRERFIDEMNKETLIIWSTGVEGEWNMQLLENPSGKTSFREFEKTIEVTDGQLCFINYEDLSMAAQFEDVQIASEQDDSRSIKIANGKYIILVRQLFNPAIYQEEQLENVHFEIIIKQAGMNSGKSKIANIFWT
jgi:hypothetical protein